MTKFGTFFLPGPTEVRPEILATLNRPLMEHRSSEFEAMFSRIQAGLSDALLTARPVYVCTSSATGLMEMAIRNTPPGLILSLVNGAFSERFAVVAESCARTVRRLTVPDGASFDIDAVEGALAEGKFVAVTLAQSETSTGVLTDVRAIATLAHDAGAMILVDSVSGAGGVELCVDAWGLDFLFTGSQKAFALPPGLAFAVASGEFIERSRGLPDRGYYFDIERYDKMAATNQTPTTPATNLLYALEAQLADIAREGIERRWDRHLRMRDMTLEWAETPSDTRDVDLRVVADEFRRSPTVTTIALPAGMKAADVVAAVAARGYTIGSGAGRLHDTTIRIGHMGDHTPDGVAACLAVVDDALTQLTRRRAVSIV